LDAEVFHAEAAGPAPAVVPAVHAGAGTAALIHAALAGAPGRGQAASTLDAFRLRTLVAAAGRAIRIRDTPDASAGGVAIPSAVRAARAHGRHVARNIPLTRVHGALVVVVGVRRSRQDRLGARLRAH